MLNSMISNLMKKLLLSCFLCWVSFAFAQMPESELPESWSLPGLEKPHSILLNQLDLERIFLEDAENDQHKSKPWRYGIVQEISIDSEREGVWTTLEDGGALWQIIFQGTDILNMSFTFNNLKLPANSRLQAYNDDRTDLITIFDHHTYQQVDELGSWFVEGNKIWVELYVPAGSTENVRVAINQVILGYRLGKVHAFFNPESGFNTSGACHYDVNCSVGVDFDVYKDEVKKAVALLNLGNGFLCSAVLMNNTNSDKVPYLLTSNHCLESSNPSLWTVRFNWISPEPVCGSIESSGENTSNMTISGAQLIASNATSDFALVQLNRSIPTSWDVAFAGWDITDTNPEFAVGIHHPNGDIMKICRDDSAVDKYKVEEIETWLIGGKSKGFGNGWEIGTTEQGSSGSPLFNENGKVIGHLIGGKAACEGTESNDEYDVYSRFAISWNHGNNPQSRLKDWLDPLNTGQTVIETLQNILNVADHTSPPELQLFPNPASSVLTVINNSFPNLHYEFYTLSGQRVKKGKVADTTNEITVHELSEGFYILRLFENGSQDAMTYKIIISR